MNFPDDQLDELRPHCEMLEAHTEGGIDYLLLRSLLLPVGCSPSSTDALLCPTPTGSYPSRLFVADKITGLGAPNWNANVRILDRNWHAYSWMVDTPGLRLAALVMNHLRIFR